MVRKWEYKDILKISEIEKQSFTDPWNYKMIADTFLCGSFTGLLYEKDDEIIGYGGFINAVGNVDITKIAVLEKHRGKGIASSLMQAMVKECNIQLADNITLEVRVSNLPAIKLYKKFGFDIISIRKNYYKNEDAYVMRLKLQG